MSEELKPLSPSIQYVADPLVYSYGNYGYDYTMTSVDGSSTSSSSTPANYSRAPTGMVASNSPTAHSSNPPLPSAPYGAYPGYYLPHGNDIQPPLPSSHLQQHHQHPQQHPGRTNTPSATTSASVDAATGQGRSDGAPSTAGPGAAATTSAGPNAGQKSRSVMACVLCRKQKMKCEGPDRAPCKRCRTAGVECAFETPPPTTTPRVRSGAASEAYVESRFGHLEERLASLEAAGTIATRSIQSDNERRIAALEAQVYALQLTASRPPPPPIQPPHQIASYTLPDTLQSAFPPSHNYPTGPSSYSNTAFSGVGRREFAQHAVAAPAKSESDAPPPFKRHKGDDEEGDFVSRGIITEDEARLCFDSYFLTFAEGPTPARTEDLRLPFDETRIRSPLLLATLISIGARSTFRDETFHAVLAEATRLCHFTFLAPLDQQPTSLDLKGIMLLSLYNGIPDLITHGIGLSFRFGMPTALLEYELLSEVDKHSMKGRILVNRGRTFIVAFLWTSFYTYCKGINGSYHIPADVLRHQLDILEGSEYSAQPSDRGIRVNAEECLILRDVFELLGPAMRKASANYDELCAIIDGGLAALVEWDRKWLDMMELVSQWGDSSELKQAIPIHHGRMCILMYLFRDIEISDHIRSLPKIAEYARMGIESALIFVKWGVESRIWMPHSMTAQYLHHVNIPTSLEMLYSTTRLFPSLTPFATIRRLLHRLINQSNNCIASPCSTAREIARAHETKKQAIELDRFAFQQSGESGMEERTEGEVEDEKSLFGDEIKKSLGAMGLELNLWGGILQGAFDD